MLPSLMLRTVSVAESFGARAVRAPRGRGSQMNVGAREAGGEFLLFLQADTVPPEGWPGLVADTLIRPGSAAGAFAFSLAEPVRFGRFIEWLVALRCRIFGTPYGDQGLFVRRGTFLKSGGFPEWAILEDVEIVRRLRRRGKIVVTREKAPTSARRWRKAGVLRTFLVHQKILLGRFLGYGPEALARERDRDR